MNVAFKYFLLYFFMIILSIGAGIGISGGFNFLTKGSFEIDQSMALTLSAVCYLCFIIYMLLRTTQQNHKPLFSDHKKDKYKAKQFFDSEWLTEEELNHKYDFSWFTDLHNHKDGIVLRAEKSGKNIKVNLMNKTYHSLIVGTTGSGKSANFVVPALQILSSTKTKPSFVINDMKGEIYELCAHKLRSEGYDIKVLDLRDAYSSTRWNPMARPYRAYQRSLHLMNEVKIHQGENPADLKLKVISPVYNNEWYEFDGKAYPTKALLENDLKALKKQLIDSAYEDLNDIATTLCPIKSQTDQSWERGAKDFVLGVMWAMLEDSGYSELGMTEDKYNFFNLYKICNERDNDPDRPFAALQKYFQGRSKFSIAPTLSSAVLNNATQTARSFFGIIGQNVSMFADAGICFTTSVDEMDFSSFADKPTAMFIKVPDEKETRHAIATMCVLQLYKDLVEIANNMPGRTLPRRVYFVLDEFAQLPTIPRFDSVITVGRSRNIAVMILVQSYTQITARYSDAVTATIKNNCNIHYFLGTTDLATKDEFSKRCGSTSVDSVSKSESNNPGANGGMQTSTSTSTSKVSAPLIHPDELSLLKQGEFIVSMFGEKALRTKFDGYFLSPDLYDMTKTPEEYAPARSLDEEKTFYNIRERNRKVFRS